MVPRTRLEINEEAVFRTNERGKEALHLQDRAFFYSQFHLDIVGQINMIQIIIKNTNFILNGTCYFIGSSSIPSS